MLLQLSPSWAAHLGSELDKPYYRALESFVNEAYASTECYPPRDKIGEAFRLCPWEAVKVVILGQDPYHEPGQAMGDWSWAWRFALALSKGWEPKKPR